MTTNETTGMTAADAKLWMERHAAVERDFGARKLVVEVYAPGSVGGTPATEVVSLHAGFDWDNGRMILKTARPVTLLTPEDVAAIHKSAREGESWHAYQRHKRWQEKYDALQAKLDAVMLEFCPEEMTPEQMKNWERHQRPVPQP